VLLVFTNASHADVTIPVTARVVSQKKLKVTYSFPQKMKKVVGIIKARHVVKQIPIEVTRKKNTIVIPLTGLKARVNDTFQVLGYKKKKVVARSAAFNFRLSKVVVPRAKNLTLHGVNAVPIIASLAVGNDSHCTVISDAVVVNKLGPCNLAVNQKTFGLQHTLRSIRLLITRPTRQVR
jgi:hypothetical protein